MVGENIMSFYCCRKKKKKKKTHNKCLFINTIIFEFHTQKKKKYIYYVEFVPGLLELLFINNI